MSRSVGIVCLAAEPGKADRNSASDGLALFPSRFRTQKEHFFAASRAPGRYVRPVQVHLAVYKRTGNVDSRKAAIAFAHPRDVGNSQAAIQIRYVQNCIHILFVGKQKPQLPAAPRNPNR